MTTKLSKSVHIRTTQVTKTMHIVSNNIDKNVYEFRAPSFFEFSPRKRSPSSNNSPRKAAANTSIFESLNGSYGNMEVDLSVPLPVMPGMRYSSTPKKDGCTQTPDKTGDEERILSDALDTLLSLNIPSRRSVRFNEKVEVHTSEESKTPATKRTPAPATQQKRPNTPTSGQSWHQALKYRSVEQRIATPKIVAGSKTRGGLISEPRFCPTPTPGVSPTTRTTMIPMRTVNVKVKVIPKPEVKVEPFKLTEYKPRQTPLEDAAKVFKATKETRENVKPAMRRLSENKQESPRTPQFRARPPVSLYRDPFVPKHIERPPTKFEPFNFQTEERVKQREIFEQRVRQNQWEIEEEKRRLAAEKERQEALEIKELRKVKVHARPVPAFVTQPTVVKSTERPASASKIPSLCQRRKLSLA